jgi:ribosomal silencing factor RsfS
VWILIDFGDLICHFLENKARSRREKNPLDLVIQSTFSHES